LPPSILIYWAMIFAWSLIFIGIYRLLFLARHWHLAHELAISEIARSFLVGVKFDAVVLSYTILPFLIASVLPLIGFEYSKIGRLIINGLFFTLMTILSLLFLVDIEYFGAMGDHLGVWFYSYFDNFGVVWYSIYATLPVIKYLLVWAALAGIFIFVSLKLYRLSMRSTKINLKSKIIYIILAVALLGIGMRGGLSLAPVDWGTAYHSNHYFANELALNGVYTLSRSLYEFYNDTSRHNPVKYSFFSHEDALKTVQDLVKSPGDSLLEPESSLKRISYPNKPDSTKYNVVVIFLESWSSRFVGVLGGRPDITPFFDSLSQKSILLKNFYASGTRTNRGLLSVLCSFPSLPGRTVMKLYGAAQPFKSIVDILSPRGYDSYFIYGGDLGFDNMGGFFRKQGFKNIVGVDDFPKSQTLNKWGVPDHLAFAKANETFAKAAQPFLGVIVTLTNHEPFMLPDKSFEVYSESTKFHDYLNTFHYSDWALGQYFLQAEKESYFKNTIFVLVGDHSKILDNPDDVINNYKIAALIYAPGMPDFKPQIVETVCGQVDLLPTILPMMGQPTEQESWGRDIFASSPIPGGFAFINNGENYGWIEDSLIFYEKVGTGLGLYKCQFDSSGTNDIYEEYPAIAKRMQHNGRAMLQLEVEMVHSPANNPVNPLSPQK
jgi:phosphoglycerol transferase MdoB-like AlkP superfamily enzyme